MAVLNLCVVGNLSFLFHFMPVDVSKCYTLDLRGLLEEKYASAFIVRGLQN